MSNATERLAVFVEAELETSRAKAATWSAELDRLAEQVRHADEQHEQHINDVAHYEHVLRVLNGLTTPVTEQEFAGRLHEALGRWRLPTGYETKSKSA